MDNSKIQLTSRPENMSDTNKLLFSILMELKSINSVIIHENKEKRSRAQTGSNKKKRIDKSGNEGGCCKFCGEFVPGNRGQLLAHYRKCEKRPKTTKPKEGDGNQTEQHI